MSIDARLKKLESSFEVHDCPTCQGKGRPRVIVTMAGEEPDLSETYCPECGAGPAVEKYVFVHLDDAAADH